MTELMFLSAYEKRGMKRLDDRPLAGVKEIVIPKDANTAMFENFKAGANDIDHSPKYDNIRPIKG